MEWKNLLAQALLVVVTAVVTFFTTRRKYKAESTSIEYQNLNTILDTYKKELAAMNERIVDYSSKIKSLEDEIHLLKGELIEFEKKFEKPAKKRKDIQNENDHT